MAFTVTGDSDAPFKTTYPLGSEDPKTLDNHGRATRKGFQERLDVDHEFTATAGAMDTADEIGKHKQVTFVDPVATPGPLASEGILYTKDVDTGGTPYAELHFCDEQDNEIEITKNGNIVLTAAAVEAAKASILAGDSVESNSGVIQVKTPDTPSEGSDKYADACGVPVIAWGSYLGSASALDIDTGITIKHLVIRSKTLVGDHGTAVEYIVCSDGTLGWRQQGPGLDSSVTITGAVFNVPIKADETHKRVNYLNITYYWFAEGTRI